MAEALAASSDLTPVELELIDGELTAAERGRAAAAGVTSVPSGSEPGAATVAVVDLPDASTVLSRFDPDRTVVFDDLDAFAGRAAMVIQPSLPRWKGSGSAARVLAGYAYAPVRAAVRDRRTAAIRRPVARTGLRVVASFGGSDPAGVGARLGPALGAVRTAHVELIVGPSHGPLETIHGIGVVRDPPDLVDRLAAADAALLAAGTMKFEAACLGRPAVLVAAADDQLAVGPAFAATGAARYLGDGRSLDPEVVVAAVEALLDDPGGRETLGRTAAAVVDGRGAERIADAIRGLSR